MGLYTKKIYEALGLVEKEKNVFYGVYKGYELTLAVNQQFFVHLNFFADGNVKAQAVRVFHTTSNQTMTNSETLAMAQVWAHLPFHKIFDNKHLSPHNLSNLYAFPLYSN